MSAERIAQAIEALRDACYLIELVPGVPDTYRVDEGGAATGPELLALAVRLRLLGAEVPGL